MTSKKVEAPERAGDTITLPEVIDDLGEATKRARPLMKKGEVLIRQGHNIWAAGSGRNAEIASRVANGETYRAIAQDYPAENGAGTISGERVRQIADAYMNKESRGLRKEASDRRRHANAVAAVKTYAAEHVQASIPEIVRETGRHLDADGVIEALGKDEALRRPMRASTGKSVRFTDEDCLAALRKAASDEDGKPTVPVSAGRYSKIIKDGPSPQTLILRYGSWRAACEAAGVKSSASARQAGTWKKGWSDDELRSYVSRFFTEVGPTGTTTDYVKWAKTVEGAPSLITVRNRLGRWTSIRIRIAANA